MQTTEQLIKKFREIISLNDIKENMQSGYGVTGVLQVESIGIDEEDMPELYWQINKIIKEVSLDAKREIARKVESIVSAELERQIKLCGVLEHERGLFEESEDIEVAIGTLIKMSQHTGFSHLFGSGASSTTIRNNAFAFLAGHTETDYADTLPRNKKFWSKCLSIAVSRGAVKR